MGRIVRAVDANIDRPVAMKLLIRGAQEQMGLQLRFTEEAQITGQLQHPNIVPVYDVGTLDDGQIYFTMKLVQGRTLRDVIRGMRNEDPVVLGRVHPDPPAHRLSAGLHGSRLCPQPRGHPPRPQTVEHHVRRLRRDPPHGLGPRQDRQDPRRRRRTTRA
jgi:hypothetical protein